MEALALPSRVALAGDWHGSRVWVQSVLASIRRADGEVRDVLHVGDFGLWPADTFLDTVDYWAERTGLRLWVTPGNHEDYGQLKESGQYISRGRLEDRLALFAAFPNQLHESSQSEDARTCNEQPHAYVHDQH